MVNRELKQRRFWMTQGNRKWRLFPVHIPWRHHICLVKCLLETNCLKMWANRCPRIQIHFRLTCVAHERSCSSSLILPPDFVRLLDFAPLNLPSESLFSKFSRPSTEEKGSKSTPQSDTYFKHVHEIAQVLTISVSHKTALPLSLALSLSKAQSCVTNAGPEPKAEAINFFNKKSFGIFFLQVIRVFFCL